MNKKEVKIVAILIIILIISIIIVFMNYLSLEKSDKSKKDTTSSTTKLVVDKTEVVSDNALKHETIKSNDNYFKATDKDRMQYEIEDIKKKTFDNYTLIKGNIKNINGKENIVLKLECSDEKNNVISSSSIEIKGLKKKESQDFEIKMMNTVFTDNYRVYVDFVGEK